jgi:hypothetical protein
VLSLRRTLFLTAAVVAAAALSPGVLLAQAPADAVAPTSGEHQLDINHASLDALKSLPIPGDVAEAIYEYRTYRSYFNSLYDLLVVEGVTPQMLETLRPLVVVTPVFQLEQEDMREEERRAQERYYVVQRFLSEEGASEGLVDDYVDQIKDPRNVNRLNYYDLVSYQNVSPVDAVAILRERALAGKIENMRQLRSASGVTYWGFRNLRDFIRYDDPEGTKTRFSGDYQFRVYNTPYTLDDYDALAENVQATISTAESNALTAEQRANLRNFDENTFAGRMNLGASDPYMTNKLRLRYGRHVKAGGITHRNLGEENWDETAKAYLEIGDYAPVSTPFGKFQLHKAVVGNYAVTLGQGLIMDATDFFMPRRTGSGYNVRSVGIRGDISRSDEYTLRGTALEGTLGRVRGTFFYSLDDKDAILNPDGSFNSYITMMPRVSNDFLEGIRDDIDAGLLKGHRESKYYTPMRDVMREQITGGNVKYEFRPGTYVGLTGLDMHYWNRLYHSDAARRWNPDPASLVMQPATRLEDRDSELYTRYNSTDLGPYRRIWGAEGSTVFENVSLAAEYGKLETSNEENALKRIFSYGPEAFIANGYIQYENFNFLALYRNYSLGYDNPYNRAFSENSKFQQTLMDGNPFRLWNPLYSYTAYNDPSPKAEEGWYFSTRYQFTRAFTLTGLEYDTYTRKADGADLKRLTIRAEYRPVFPVRFRVRHRLSGRHDQRPDDIRAFQSWDTRLEMRVNLSNYDQMGFLYSTTNVTFADRPRLSAPAAGGNTSTNLVGSRGIPAKAVQATYTHNFSDFLTATVSAEIYDGFLYNFEDNEFVVLDGNGFRNWFMVRSRLSENLSWRFKWTADHQLPRTFVDIRNFGDLISPTPDGTDAMGEQSTYRFQLDYSF